MPLVERALRRAVSACIGCWAAWLGTQPAVIVAADPPAAVPVWYGELDTGDRLFRLVVETLSADGVTGFQLRSVDDGEAIFPIDSWSQPDRRLSFAVPRIKAEFAGELDETGSVVGTWTQLDVPRPLSLRPVAGERVPPPPDEVWMGTLDAVVQKLPLRVRIHATADGGRDVRLDSIAQRVGGFRCKHTVDDTAWAIDVPSLRASFSGTLGEDGVVRGMWKQGGVTLPLSFAKVAVDEATAPPAPPRRPQQPRPPFPYEQREVRFPGGPEASGDRVTLAGTLTLPPGRGPHPAVVLVSGSGPQDRDETIADHKPFLVLADTFTRAGIAVLRYDDRGAARSSGNHATATSADFAADVEAAVEWLAEQEGIDAERIALTGHSEGGLVVAMVAARRPTLAGIVLLAGTGVDGARILGSQSELVMRAEGVTDEGIIRRARVIQGALLDAVRETEPGASAADVAARARPKVDAALADELAAADAAAREALDTALVGGAARLASPWFRFFITHDPAADLAKVTCPVLAIVGGKDVQVDPGLNLPPIRAALGTNPDVTVEELPGLNHLFQPCTTGGVSEYAMIEETIDPAALGMVRDWLVTRLLPAPAADR